MPVINAFLLFTACSDDSNRLFTLHAADVNKEAGLVLFAVLVQWHDPTFSRNLAWSNNNHFYAFFNSF